MNISQNAFDSGQEVGQRCYPQRPESTTLRGDLQIAWSAHDASMTSPDMQASQRGALGDLVPGHDDEEGELDYPVDLDDSPAASSHASSVQTGAVNEAGEGEDSESLGDSRKEQGSDAGDEASGFP